MFRVEFANPVGAILVPSGDLAVTINDND